jgi:hypothetical protein
MKKTKKDLEGKGPYQDLQSDESKERTTGITSQDELRVPRITRDDLPEADRKDFKNGVYSGPGTGAALGSTAETGGADTWDPESHPRMGTTDGTRGSGVPGGSIEHSSPMTDQFANIDRRAKNSEEEREVEE